MAAMKGSVLGVILHDICEEIRLEELREILGAKRVEPGFKHATPEYVRFEQPPVVERLDPIVLTSGETLSLQVKYYDYGVVSVVLELGFEGDWEELIQLAARWVPNAELERQAQQIIRGRLERIAPAIGRLYTDWLSEDYYIFLLSDIPDRPQGLSCWQRTARGSRRCCGASKCPWRAAKMMTLFRPAFRTIPTIWWSLDGMPHWFTTDR